MIKGTKRKGSVSIGGALVGLIVLFILFSFLSPAFLQVYNLINILRQSSINLILTVGMTFIILTGGIDLAVGGIQALVGTLVAGCLVGGMPLIPALLIGLLVGAIFGSLAGVSVAYGKIPAFITTMATCKIARSIAFLYSGGYPITGLPEKFAFLGSGTVYGIPVPVIIAVVVVAFGFFILKKTVLGRYIYALGGNEQAATFSGINVKVWKVIIYALSGFLTAIAGCILIARMNSGQPSAADGSELDIIAAVVIGGTSLSGGTGGLFGSIVGCLLITLLNNGLTLLNVNTYIQSIILGCVILGSVLLDMKKSDK